jgi:multicomponent Na+:H+ antiporter subunit B
MRGVALGLAAVVAAVLIVAVAGLPYHATPDAPVHAHVGGRVVERGLEETGMRNLVTAVLLGYRGLDTFLEVVVIFTALLAVLALPWRSIAASATAPAADAIPVAAVVSVVVRALAPFIAVFALATLYRGHVSPGGGFQSAAVAAALMVALTLVMGRDSVARLLPVRARPLLQAVAPLAFAVVALVGWRLTGAFLGLPADPAAHALREALVFTLEVAIAVGGAVVLTRLFLALEG